MAQKPRPGVRISPKTHELLEYMARTTSLTYIKILEKAMKYFADAFDDNPNIIMEVKNERGK